MHGRCSPPIFVSWITISETQVKASLNDDELRLYREKIAEGDADPLSGIIADVVAEVRGYVLTRHPPGAAGTIPPGLRNAAVDIIIYRLAKRLQIKSEEQRKPANDDAVALLQRVAEGKVFVEADDGSISVPLPSASERDLTHTRADQDGV